MTWLLKFFGEVWDWILCHTLTRYHLLDLRDRGEGHGYRGGWMDRDHLMLIACFTLLRDFVEKESPDIGLGGEEADSESGYLQEDREAVAQQIADGREVRELYEWWVEGRSEERDEVDALLADADGLDVAELADHPNFTEWSRRSDELETRDDAQLLRLVKVRGRLWT